MSALKAVDQFLQAVNGQIALTKPNMANVDNAKPAPQFNNSATTVASSGSSTAEDIATPLVQASVSEDKDQITSGHSEADHTTVGQTEVDQSTVGQTEAEQTTFGKTEVYQTTVGQSDAEKTTFRQPEAEQTTVGQTEAEQTTFGQSEDEQTTVGQSDAEKTTFGQPEADQTTVGQLEAEKTTFGQSEAEKTTVGQSEAEQTTVGQSEAEKTTDGQSEAEKTTVIKSETEQTSVGQSEAEQTTAGKSEDEQTTVRQSEIGQTTDRQSEADKTTVGQSEAEKTTVGQSEAEKTTVIQSETEQTTVGQSEIKETTVGQSETKQTTVGLSEAENNVLGQSEDEQNTLGKPETVQTTTKQPEDEPTTLGHHAVELTTVIMSEDMNPADTTTQGSVDFTVIPREETTVIDSSEETTKYLEQEESHISGPSDNITVESQSKNTTAAVPATELASDVLPALHNNTELISIVMPAPVESSDTSEVSISDLVNSIEAQVVTSVENLFYDDTDNEIADSEPIDGTIVQQGFTTTAMPFFVKSTAEPSGGQNSGTESQTLSEVVKSTASGNTAITTSDIDESENEINDNAIKEEFKATTFPLAVSQLEDNNSIANDTSPKIVSTSVTQEMAFTSSVQTSSDPTFSTAQLLDEEPGSPDGSITLTATTQLNVFEQDQIGIAGAVEDDQIFKIDNAEGSVSLQELDNKDGVYQVAMTEGPEVQYDDIDDDDDNEGSTLWSDNLESSVEITTSFVSYNEMELDLQTEITTEQLDLASRQTSPKSVPDQTFTEEGFLPIESGEPVVISDQDVDQTTIASVKNVETFHVTAEQDMPVEETTVISPKYFEVEPVFAEEIFEFDETTIESMKKWEVDAVVAEETVEFDETTIDSIKVFEVEAAVAEENKELEKTTIDPLQDDFKVEAVVAEEIKEFDETTIESMKNFEVEAVFAEENFEFDETTISSMKVQGTEINKFDKNATDSMKDLEVQAVVAEETTQVSQMIGHNQDINHVETTTGTESLITASKPPTVPEIQALEAEIGFDNFVEFAETTTGSFFKITNASLEDPETTQRGFKDSDTSLNVIVDYVLGNKSEEKGDDSEEKEGTTITVSVIQTIQETTSRQIVPLAEFIEKYQNKGQMEGTNMTVPVGEPSKIDGHENPMMKAVIKEESGIVQVNKKNFFYQF